MAGGDPERGRRAKETEILKGGLGDPHRGQARASCSSGRGALLEENRLQVLAVAHALERFKTITGEDVLAIIDGRPGPFIDGRRYHTDEFRADGRGVPPPDRRRPCRAEPRAIPLPVVPGVVDGRAAGRAGRTRPSPTRGSPTRSKPGLLGPADGGLPPARGPGAAALDTSSASRRSEIRATSSTARAKASLFAWDGLVEPLILRTYWQRRALDLLRARRGSDVVQALDASAHGSSSIEGTGTRALSPGNQCWSRTVSTTHLDRGVRCGLRPGLDSFTTSSCRQFFCHLLLSVW